MLHSRPLLSVEWDVNVSSGTLNSTIPYLLSVVLDVTSGVDVVVPF